MLAPWAGIGVMVATGLTLLVGLAAWRAVYAPHPELVRKLLHVGIGMIVLAFPWVFAEVWPALVVVGAALLVLAALRLPTPWGHRLRGVLDDVGRISRGDVYFLIAAAVIFALASGDPLMFSVPLLVLTFADTAAALIGVNFGRIRLAPGAGGKTVEGSIAFFVVAFLCAQIPIMLLGDNTPSEALAVAGVLACVTTMTEAFSRNGLDNLLVPFAAFGGLIVML